MCSDAGGEEWAGAVAIYLKFSRAWRRETGGRHASWCWQQRRAYGGGVGLGVFSYVCVCVERVDASGGVFDGGVCVLEPAALPFVLVS